MQNLAELRAGACKAAIEIIVGVATGVATTVAVQGVDMIKSKQPEAAPIRIELVLPAQKATPDTTIQLREAMDAKRFPARPMAAPAAAQKAQPMLLK